MYICWLKKKTKQKHWMNVNTIVKLPLTENRDHWGWQYYCQTSVDWKKVIIEGDNIIVKPLLTEKKGSLRVTILLSNLCWLNNGIIEGDNIIVKPLLTENGSLRVTILLSHLLKQNRDCRVNNKIENVKSLWHTDEQWKLFHQKCLTESSAQMT